MEKLAAHYLQLLESILRNPSATIAELGILTPRKKSKFLARLTRGSRKRLLRPRSTGCLRNRRNARRKRQLSCTRMTD
ncbi:hypothetical protein [Paenibacillus polymyxa]|uniref:hypothetical protein n=1 Tax=Paenibacillus polymyxa TaxID=1406 RepID=UPI00399338EA